jgi:O-antigen ligase/tetratricopeptide (TPR) repeat protein
LKQTAGIVASLGIFIAVQAILQKLTSPGLIYWFREGLSTTPMGPWVYRNHFAGFMEMIFPLTMALFLYYRPEVQYEKSLKEKCIALFTMPGANRYLLLGTGVILMAVSILLSLSRGGIITLSTAFLFFTLFTAWMTPAGRIKWSIVIFVSIILMITWFGWQPIMERFGHIWGSEGLNSGGRLPVLRDSLGIVRSFPLFGTGFGTFIDIYPTFRTVPGDAIFDHAHNDYLELLTDGGLVGFVLSAWFVAAVINRSAGTLLKRREYYSILITSGAFTALLALLLHCFVDFQMYNGANGLYFFFICGLAVSGAHTRIHYKTRSSLLKKSSLFSVSTAGFLAFSLLISSSWYNSGMYLAGQTVAPVQSLFINRHIPAARLGEIHALYADAAGLDPLEADYRFQQGRISSILKKDDRALQEFSQAVRRSPMSGQYVQQLGLALPQAKKNTAGAIIAAGPIREPRNIDMYLTYSRWLLRNGERKQAAGILTQAFLRRPDKASEIADFIVTNHFSASEIEDILPAQAFTWYEMGFFMEKGNRLDEAEQYYLRALDYVNPGTAEPVYFTRLYSLYRKQKKKDEALEILRSGIQFLPDHPQFRVQLGDYYLQQGIPYRAREEYLQELRIDPKNRAIQLKVRKLDSREPEK